MLDLNISILTKCSLVNCIFFLIQCINARYFQSTFTLYLRTSFATSRSDNFLYAILYFYCIKNFLK